MFDDVFDGTLTERVIERHNGHAARCEGQNQDGELVSVRTVDRNVRAF